jgi:hypothetical protein
VIRAERASAAGELTTRQTDVATRLWHTVCAPPAASALNEPYVAEAPFSKRSTTLRLTLPGQICGYALGVYCVIFVPCRPSPPIKPF